MAITTVNELIAAVGASRLLEPQQDAAVKQMQRQYTDPRALAKAIVDKGWLTAYQIKRVANGKTADLTIGQYTLIDILGEGGMGQVFKARHRGLNRLVALKVIRKERLGNPDAIRRFLREIRATSQLAHPNIVLALDAEQAGDTHFIAMEYVEGADLLKVLKKQGPLSAAQACDYAYQAALGLQHAFEVGLVHRDIKPSNLLVTTDPALLRQARGGKTRIGKEYPFGLLKILDLGLARIVDPGDGEHSATLTHAGAVVGTPDYVSPEQARDSRTVDIRSDIYSLGCTLFHILTGRVPYPGGTGMEKLFKHQIEAPPVIEEVRTDLPKGLPALLTRMLAKQPADRPQTPAELAKLLLPFAQDKSAAANFVTPPGTQAFEQTVDDPEESTPHSPGKKRVSALRGGATPAPAAPRRKLRWLVAGTAVMGLMLLFVGGGVLLLMAGPGATGGTQPDTTQQVVNNTSKTTERPLQTKLVNLTTRPTLRPPPTTPIIIPKVTTALDQLDPLQIPLAERTGLPPETVAVIGQQRFRHWGAVQAAAFSPDRRHFATMGSDRQIRLWDLASGELRKSYPIDMITYGGAALAFNPAGTQLTVLSTQASVVTVRVLDLATGKTLASLPSAKTEGRPMAISPDGQLVVMAALDASAGRLIEIMTEKERVALPTAVIHGYSFSADAKSLVTWSRVGKPTNDARVWDTVTGKERSTIPLGAAPPSAVAISADGQQLAVVQISTGLRIFSTATGTETATRPLTANTPSLAFAPDGKALALASIDRLRLHNVATGAEREIGTLAGGAAAGQFQFSPDGVALMLFGTYEPCVRMWNVSTGKEVGISEGMGGMMMTAALSPDGRTLAASAGTNRPGVKIWDVFTGKLRATVGDSVAGTALVAITSEGRNVLSRSTTGLTLWDSQTGVERQALSLPSAHYGASQTTPNGQTVFVSQMSGAGWTGGIFDGGTLRRTPLEGIKNSYAVSLSADGKHFAAAEYGMGAGGMARGRIRLWETTTGKELPLTLPQLAGTIYSVALSPDGQLLAAAASDGSVHMWNTANGQEILTHRDAGTPGAPKGYSYMLSFSPTGDNLLGWGAQAFKMWDTATGKERVGFQGHNEPISAAAFAPHGRTIATADRSGRLIVWNSATGSELRRIQMPGTVNSLFFAADGTHLVTCNSNGTFYVLRLPA